MKKYILSFLFFVLLLVPIQLDAKDNLSMVWGDPQDYIYADLLGSKKKAVVWFYQISNKTGEKQTAYINITLVTDTGKQYDDTWSPLVEVKLLGKEHEQYEDCLTMGGDFYNGVTKKGMAVFPNVDPGSTEIMIYVSGLADSYWRENNLVQSVYKITYKRSNNKWTKLKHGWETQKVQ